MGDGTERDLSHGRRSDQTFNVPTLATKHICKLTHKSALPNTRSTNNKDGPIADDRSTQLLELHFAADQWCVHGRKR